MNFGTIRINDIANGPGIRTSLYVSGCTNHCKGCFQPQTWDFDYGDKFDENALVLILNSLSPKHVRGLTILGGEPFEFENQSTVYLIAMMVKKCFPEKDLWIYTGNTWDDIRPHGRRYYSWLTDAILRKADVLVDGPYVEELRDPMLQFRGSSNQRIIDLKKTLSSGTVVLWDED